MSKALRLAPDLIYLGPEQSPMGNFPTIIAQVKNPSLGLVALHRTYLAPADSVAYPGKAALATPSLPVKKLTPAVRAGAVSGAAIELYPLDKTQTLAVAEGIETAIAVHEATGVPAWSTISAGGMGAFIPPASVRILEIWADQGEAGQKAAVQLAERAAYELNLETYVMTPEAGQFADNPQTTTDKETTKNSEKTNNYELSTQTNLDNPQTTDSGADSENLQSVPDWLDIYTLSGADALREARGTTEVFRRLPGQLPEVKIQHKENLTIQAAAAALPSSTKIFQRSGSLVRIIREAKKPPKPHSRDLGITVAENSPRIELLPKPVLRTEICLLSDILAFNSKKKSWEPAHPTEWLVNGLYHAGEWPGLRPLRGIVETPVIRSDGSILTEPGYDQATELVFDPQGVNFPTILDHPTKQQARDSLLRLIDLVAEFPFEDDEHLSAWIASVLTPFARHAFDGPSPFFLMDANVRGSGKTLLCDLAGLIFSGREMAKFSYADDDNEIRKRITAIALAGRPMVLIDNVAGKLASPSLDAAITSTTWSDRVLGESKTTGDLPMLAAWYASGNNITLGGDLPRRTLHIRLNSELENPEDRDGFKYDDVRSFVKQNRPQLVADILTILRAYHAAGRPSTSAKRWGSFEGWSSLVRNSIIWAGMADPRGAEATKSSSMASDEQSDLETLGKMLNGWEELDPGNEGMTTSQVIEELQEGSGNSAGNSDFGADGYHSTTELRKAIMEFCPGQNGRLPTARALGTKLSKVRGRVKAGRCFKSDRNRDHVMIWRIVKPRSRPALPSFATQETLTNAWKSEKVETDQKAAQPTQIPKAPQGDKSAGTEGTCSEANNVVPAKKHCNTSITGTEGTEGTISPTGGEPTNGEQELGFVSLLYMDKKFSAQTPIPQRAPSDSEVPSVPAPDPGDDSSTSSPGNPSTPATPAEGKEKDEDADADSGEAGDDPARDISPGSFSGGEEGGCEKKVVDGGGGILDVSEMTEEEIRRKLAERMDWEGFEI